VSKGSIRSKNIFGTSTVIFQGNFSRIYGSPIALPWPGTHLSFWQSTGAILDSALAVLQTSKNLILAERELILNYIGYYETSISKFPNKNGAIVKEYLGRLVDLWNLNLWLKQRIGQKKADPLRIIFRGEHGSILRIYLTPRS